MYPKTGRLMMESVTISDSDFKTIHNALCDLRWAVDAMDHSIIKTERFENIVAQFEQGLKGAYAQDNDAFDRKHDYYYMFQQDNGLKAIWSIFSLPEHGFLRDHPWQGAKVLVYKGATAQILGQTWGDLYRAADQVIERSGDQHHIFIEAFGKYATDNSMLTLTTGS
jgi:hypothetical protein